MGWGSEHKSHFNIAVPFMRIEGRDPIWLLCPSSVDSASTRGRLSTYSDIRLIGVHLSVEALLAVLEFREGQLPAGSSRIRCRWALPDRKSSWHFASKRTAVSMCARSAMVERCRGFRLAVCLVCDGVRMTPHLSIWLFRRWWRGSGPAGTLTGGSTRFEVASVRWHQSVAVIRMTCGMYRLSCVGWRGLG